jgi:hypothetical protein
MKQGLAVLADGATFAHLDLGGLYFIDSDGYLTLNCCKCGDEETGTLIAFVEAGDTMLDRLFKALAHVCEEL